MFVLCEMFWMCLLIWFSIYSYSLFCILVSHSAICIGKEVKHTFFSKNSGKWVYFYILIISKWNWYHHLILSLWSCFYIFVSKNEKNFKAKAVYICADFCASAKTNYKKPSTSVWKVIRRKNEDSTMSQFLFKMKNN